MSFTLPKLKYDYNALEPYIDARTMEVHHSKHHQGYVDKLNVALQNFPELAEQTLEYLLKNIDHLPVDEATRAAIRNNGGGVFNHNLFWEIMAPEKDIKDALVEKIGEAFGSVEEFKKIFSEAAAKQFGSGWAWLVADQEGNLQVYSLPNQDCPLSQGHEPIIGLDVWEHAYYLKYQNKRPDYIESWFNVLKLI